MSTITSVVQQAIREIEANFAVQTHPDGAGGAFVRVDNAPFGSAYEPDHGWVAFRITYNYPYADIYPHHIPPNVVRRDGCPLGDGFHQSNIEEGPFNGPSIMVSRRSNRWDPNEDNAALKLIKVLDWIRTRS